MPAKTRQRATVARRIQMLPVDRLVPSAENGRRSISNNSLKSLARSIKRNGVLQPILARVHPTEPDKWEIRAGFRRWRAAKLAGLTTVPAIVSKLDDESALAVTITENLQRENLHPLEEAAVIQSALDHGFDVEAVAARLGKRPEFVARRASLSRLIEAWRKAVLTADSPASRLSPAHLELIARLPDETQLLLAQDDFFTVFGRGFPSVDDLHRIIDGGLHTLAAMPWRLDDETLEPQAGACVNCPKRSGAQPLLFDGEDVPKNGKPSKTDRCLDPACFGRKQVAHVQRCEAELRAAHADLQLVQIGGGSLSESAHQAFGERVQRLYAPSFVKASDPNAVAAMQVDGPKAGKLVYIDSGQSQIPARGRKHRQAKPDEPRKPATLEERQMRHFRRRQAFIVKQVETRVRELTLEDVAKSLARQQPASGDGALDTTSLLLAFGSSGRADRPWGDDPWERYDRLRTAADQERVAAAVHDVAQIWVRRLTVHDSDRVEFQAAEAKRVCEILRTDFAAIEVEAVRALPQPKSWGLPPEELPQATQPSGDHPHDAAEAADADAGDAGEPPPASSDSEPRAKRPTRARRVQRTKRRGRKVRAA